MLSQRHNFAVQHLIAASRFARMCFSVEQDQNNNTFGPFFDEVISYVSAAVLSSVAALEANINEVFSDVQDGIIVIEGVDVESLLISWEKVEKKALLAKYDYFLSLTNRPTLNKGDTMYQYASILIRVRNALVHYKPEWYSAQRNHLTISRQLQGKFSFSPFVDKRAPIFPMRCMTHGLAEWSVQTVLRFAESFSNAACVPDRFQLYSDRFRTT